MGMSTHVIGFRSADDQWKKMKKIWDDCEEADVEIPEKVEEFFGNEYPGDKPGMEVELGNAVTPYKDDMQEGFEINIKKIPKDVSILRFYNSY